MCGAGEYEGGLYIQEGADATSRLMVDRSFEVGDVLLHRFDVMHGVEVAAGSRYSLVLWLSDCAESAHARVTPWLRGAADSGNAYAQFLYAEACKTGSYGVEQDLSRAVQYGLRAARQGHALSQHQLGFMYQAGRGVERSDERCRELWLSAAEAGLASAQLDVAKCLAYGFAPFKPEYVELLGLSSRHEAQRWFERAVRQGHVEAAEELRNWRRQLEIDDPLATVSRLGGRGPPN